MSDKYKKYMLFGSYCDTEPFFTCDSEDEVIAKIKQEKFVIKEEFNCGGENENFLGIVVISENKAKETGFVSSYVDDNGEIDLYACAILPF